VGAAQGVPQVPHPRGGDLQTTRPGRQSAQTEIELALPLGEPLLRRSPQRLQIGLVTTRPQVLNLARPTPRRVHDLDRRRPDAVLTVRTHGATSREYEPD
jgi:hypothetical protein